MELMLAESGQSEGKYKILGYMVDGGGGGGDGGNLCIICNSSSNY